jgi:hypothetical protein
MGYSGGYGGYDAAQQLLGPCRRASVLIFVLAGLGALAGFCLAAVFPALPLEQAMQQQGLTLPPGQTLDSFRHAAMVTGVVIVVVSVVYIVLGVLVRRASKGAAITAIVLTILALIYLVLSILASLLMASRGGGAGEGAMGVCLLIVPLALMIWLLVWLSQAVGAAGRWQQWQMQAQQMQYGAYPNMYGQAAPGQPGYGYPLPPPQQNWQQQQQPGWGPPGGQAPPPPQQQQQQQQQPNWPPQPPPPPANPT